MTEDFIYLDYNATTPVDPRVAEAMAPYLTGFIGNPSSTHRYGREARAASPRPRLGDTIDGPSEVVHCSEHP